MRTVWMSLVAALGLGLAGLIAPRSSAAPAPPRPGPAVEARRAAVDPLHLARLTRYTATATAPLLLGRDPFSFNLERASDLRVARPSRPNDAPARVPPTEPAVTEPPPRLPALAGIAEQSGPAGIVRTAVLTEPDGAVRFVVLGQTLDHLYLVAEIGPDRVILVNARTGEAAQLVLK